MSASVSGTTYFPRTRCASLDDAPASPSSYDDEFTGAALAAKWTKWASGVAFSANAIDPYAGFAGEHRESYNSYRPSWYMVQPASTGFCGIYQAVTLPSECFVWARLSFNMRYTSNADNDFENGISLCANSGGAPDLNNRVMVYLNESAAGVAHTWGGKVTAGVFAVSQGKDLVPGFLAANSVYQQSFCYVGIQKISTTYHFCVGNTAGTWMWLTAQTHASTMAWLAYTGNNSSTAAPGNMIMGIDFIRYQTGRFLP